MPIPKIIHYCWFGGNPMPASIQKYVETWKQNCPDYTFFCWTEKNYDVCKNDYLKEAYQAGKWAFVSDFCRLDVLYTYGGIYLDTDVEMVKPLTPFLNARAFCGFEVKDTLSTAVIGAEKGHDIIGDMLASYANEHFIVNGIENCTPNVIRLTNLCRVRGLKLNGRRQALQDIEVYPQVVFSPNSFSQVYNVLPSATTTVHHMIGSWCPHTRKSNMAGRLRTWCVGALRNTAGSSNVTKLSCLLHKRRRGRALCL